ncbi:LVIVD repeat-containing protein [Paraconexibacter algicola]|uniref:LVIVD repeat-containing protein n=1 Tax=Paraconexibacter algicola TaxID=2133960 RepID=UPI001304D184|nr:hypothetical protein [Paraconexibacter algicola]
MGQCRTRHALAVLTAAVTVGAVAVPAAAHLPGRALPAIEGPTLPANDLEALLSLTGGQVVQSFGVATRAPEPPLRPVPRADCGPGSRPLQGEIQGRVSRADLDAPEAARGYTCNVSPLGRYPTAGGFRTWRYVDPAGHECAFYDTSLPAPANVVSVAAGPTPGVVVLDMSDPQQPKRTALLTTLAMLAPHESLNLNARRGLLAAVVGNGLTLPGSMAIYDVATDCRRPRLLAEMPTAYGHESGFAPDGNTFWIAGGGGEVIAVDVRDPRVPRTVWRGVLYSHGLNLSDDGRTLFHTDPINGNLGILDVSEVQDRRPDPTVRQLSRITWDTVSVPQNTVPLTIRGRRYLLEFDEFAFRFNPPTVANRAGAARLIDIEDPRAPRVTSNLRLEANMPETRAKLLADPVALPLAFGYAAHYCAAPREVDPVIVACSFINSGLRVFDVRDPENPREVAYYVAPEGGEGLAATTPGNLALSQPAFDPVRREVWYTDATSGFHALRLDERAWPADPPPTRCVSQRTVTITLPRHYASAHVTYLGRRARVTRTRGRLRARIDLRGQPVRTVTVRVTGRSKAGTAVRQTRRFLTCRGRG